MGKQRYYTVLRDIGDSDYPPGSVLDAAALNPLRVLRLVEQRRIEPAESEPIERDAEDEPAMVRRGRRA